MPSALNLIVLGRLRAVGKNGIRGGGLVWPVDLPASGNRQFVREFCPSFRDEQIVPSVFLVDVRAFRI